MKILILIPLWKRPEVFEICASNLVSFIDYADQEYSISVLTIVSPEDPFINDLVKISMDSGFDICYYKNEPVSNKINYGISYSFTKDYDYLMNFGSDDLIHPEIFKLYKPCFDKRRQFFGVRNLYFYKIVDKMALFYKNYDNAKSVGAGRMISRDLLLKIVKQNQFIYEQGISRGMDNSSSRRITSFTGVRDISVDSGNFPYIVDLKSDENINCFSTWRKVKHKATNIKKDVLQRHYPHIKVFS